MKTMRALLAALLLFTAAHAQTAPPPAAPAPVQTPAPAPLSLPAPDAGPTIFHSFTVWGGPSTEVYIFSGASVAVSLPLSGDSALRLGAEMILIPFPDVNGPIPVVNAEVLFGSTFGETTVYGGPSLGTALGAVWLLGGVVGVHSPFGSSPVGWYVESRLRFATDVQSFVTFLPGGSLGLTLRL